MVSYQILNLVPSLVYLYSKSISFNVLGDILVHKTVKWLIGFDFPGTCEYAVLEW